MKKLLNNSGFGIIEVIISLALVAIMVVSLGNVLGSIYKLYSAGKYKTQAYSFAQEPIEILNGIKNQHFACVCDDPDDCSSGSCVNVTDGQTCELRDNFTSCWMEYPENVSTVTRYYMQDLGTSWQLTTLTPGTKEIISANPNFSREILIENMLRNDDGDLDEAGTNLDYNTKKISVNVYWTERGTEKSITIHNIFTAWKSL